MHLLARGARAHGTCSWGLRAGAALKALQKGYGRDGFCQLPMATLGPGLGLYIPGS